MPAKGDGLPVGLTTVGVAAIAVFEIDQSKMPRADADATKLERGGALERREFCRGFDRGPGRARDCGVFGNALFGTRFQQPLQIRLPWRGPWRLWGRLANRLSLPRKSHPPGTTDRGAAGIGSFETFVQCLCGLRKRHPFFDKLTQPA